LVIPCIPRFTAIGRSKLHQCGYPCHDYLLAYRPNVWFAAQSRDILQAVRGPPWAQDQHAREKVKRRS